MSMHFMCLEEQYDVLVPYRGGRTIKNLIDEIQGGETPENYIDQRLTDEHFPQTREGDEPISVWLASFSYWLRCKENVVDYLRGDGYVPVNPAELLALRAKHPRTRFMRSVALAQSWKDHNGYARVPCIGSGAGSGLRLREFNSGWAPFWKFAIKKTENE